MKTKQATEPPKVPTVEELQVFISQALTALSKSLRTIEDLNDTFQRSLGFATDETKQLMDEQIRKERVDNHWNITRGYSTGSGEMPAQGNLRAWAMHVQIHTTLADVTRRMIRSLDRVGIRVVHRVPPEPETRDLIAAVRTLSWHAPSVRLLTGVLRDLEHQVDAAKKLIDGADRKALNGPCPHCDQMTLVVYLTGEDEGTIRCETKPTTWCVCPDPLCDCKANPRHRHEWYRDRGTTGNGWWSLADRLNLTKQITRSP